MPHLDHNRRNACIHPTQVLYRLNRRGHFAGARRDRQGIAITGEKHIWPNKTATGACHAVGRAPFRVLCPTLDFWFPPQSPPICREPRSQLIHAAPKSVSNRTSKRIYLPALSDSRHQWQRQCRRRTPFPSLLAHQSTKDTSLQKAQSNFSFKNVCTVAQRLVRSWACWRLQATRGECGYQIQICLETRLNELPSMRQAISRTYNIVC